MYFDNNINNILHNKKFFYAPIINGLLENKIIEFLTKNGFYNFTLPELNPSLFNKEHLIVFEIEDKKIELNSSNAMKISALSAIYGKVFSISRTFRKENEVDNSHLSEFKMLELEFKSSNENEIFEFIENLLKYIIDWFNNFITSNKLIDIFNLKKIDFPIERKNYEKIVLEHLLNGEKIYFDDFNFSDIEISKNISNPLYVMYYPPEGSWRAKKKDSIHAYLYNLILPDNYGELIEFSIRETNFQFYYDKFKKLDYLGKYDWYLSAIKYNQDQRAGLGLGIERLGCWLMDLKDIGNQLVFPRKP